jgi:serine/threonine-protein kinase RsbW
VVAVNVQYDPGQGAQGRIVPDSSSAERESGAAAHTLRLAASDRELPRRDERTGERVALRVPAASAYLSVLRTATSGLAARMDFPLDEIEDLRIAVDEACVMLLSAAVPGADMEVEFGLAADVLYFSVTVPTLTGVRPPTDTFSWTVLCALAEGVASHTGPDNRVTIGLRKRRALARPGGTAP